jgi:hypothetical protein
MPIDCHETVTYTQTIQLFGFLKKKSLRQNYRKAAWLEHIKKADFNQLFL